VVVVGDDAGTEPCGVFNHVRANRQLPDTILIVDYFS